MDARRFTLDEANRVLPAVEKGLAEAKATLDRIRDVRDQLTDLRIVWGPKVLEPTCPDHAEYLSFQNEFTRLERDLGAALERIRSLGCQVKDPEAGLVDFHAERSGETVLLCWRRGEPRIQFWHSLEGGFAGRKPITSF